MLDALLKRVFGAETRAKPHAQLTVQGEYREILGLDRVTRSGGSAHTSLRPRKLKNVTALRTKYFQSNRLRDTHEHLSADSDFETYGNVPEATLLYASLDEQVVRRKNVIRNLKGRVPFAFVRCVDGRGWTEADTEAVLSESMRDHRRSEFAKGRAWLAKGAIACAVTHRSNMLGRISDFGKVLCEDDAVISDDLVDLLASGEIQSKLEMLDGITLFHYQSSSDIIAKREPVARFGRYTVHKVRPANMCSAACYFVPSSIAPRIVELQTPITVPVDSWRGMIKGRAFDNLYIVHPRPARVGDFPTTIGYASPKSRMRFDSISRVVLFRRAKRTLTRLRGHLKERVTRWVDEI